MVNGRLLLVSKTKTTMLLSNSVEPMYAMQTKTQTTRKWKKNREGKSYRGGGIDPNNKRAKKRVVVVIGDTWRMEEVSGDDSIWSSFFFFLLCIFGASLLRCFFFFCILYPQCHLRFVVRSSLSLFFCLTVLFLSPDPKKSCCDGDPGLGTRRGNRERGLDRSPFFSSVSRLALTVCSALDEVVFIPPALPFALPCPLYA